MPELGREGGGGAANLGNAQIYTAFVLKALPYVLATPISLYLLSVCQKEVY